MFGMVDKLDVWLDSRWLLFTHWFAETFPLLNFLWNVPFIAWCFLWVGFAFGMVTMKFGWLGGLILTGLMIGMALAGRLFL